MIQLKEEDPYVKKNLGYVRELAIWTKRIIAKDKENTLEKQKKTDIEKSAKKPMFSEGTLEKLRKANREKTEEIEKVI